MYQRPQFDHRQKFVVVKDFKFAGRMFLIDQEFPWRTIGCNVRRLGQMYKARMLKMLEAQEPVSEEKLLAMEPEVKPVVKEVVKPVVTEVKTEVVDTSEEDKKPELSDEEKKAKKSARRKAARKAAKLAKEAKGE